MCDDAWTVVKVGGSLFDWPLLGERLSSWLTRLDASRVLLVAGGGPAADALRELDVVDPLGDDAAHWLAIEAMSFNARALQERLPTARIVCEIPDPAFLACASGWYLLDALPFFRADESNAGHLPHSWRVTSDSLAVRAAVLAKARELILLKSVSWPGTDWTEAMHAGIVDAYFMDALRQSPSDMRIRIVNLRTWS
jgi:aspartokinase-like uncharacterized kinase